MLPERGSGSGWVCLRVASSAWILDSVQEEFLKRIPGDFENMFIKAGDAETRIRLVGNEKRKRDWTGGASGTV